MTQVLTQTEDRNTGLLQSPSERITSIDLLRGFIIVIMGLDHVRDFVAITPFVPEDVTQTTPAWFFVRWITHYCAPLFIFLAGISAFLYGEKVNDKKNLSLFLLKRGIWLIVIEVLVVNFGWQFSYDFTFLQVIWAIGCSMIVLSALIWLPVPLIGAFAFILITGHNLLDKVDNDSFLWSILHMQKMWTMPVTGTPLMVIYPLIPWPGVMAAGYVMGHLLLKPYPIRKKYFTLTGIALVAIFIILRFSNAYGDSQLWSIQERGIIYTFLSFLNTSKYPPSLLYLCMTLGPALIILPHLEKVKGKVADFFLTFGKVPFFYYILHVPLIRVIAIIIGGLQYDVWKPWFFSSSTEWPTGYEPSLLLALAVWVFVTVILYFCCRWFASVKKRRNDWWLKYL
jgi:uncharacterized membrane protein